MKVSHAAKTWMDYHRSHSKKTPCDPMSQGGDPDYGITPVSCDSGPQSHIFRNLM